MEFFQPAHEPAHAIHLPRDHLCVAIAAVTSRWWRTASDIQQRSGDAKLLRFAWATAILSYLQLVIGAWLRHLSAGATGDLRHGRFRVRRGQGFGEEACKSPSVRRDQGKH